MSDVSAIVLAAGKGLRFGAKIPKPLLKLNAKPILIYCLNTLSRCREIKEIILVVNPENLKAIIRKIKPYRIKKLKAVVLGGRERQDSVINGLKSLNPKTDLVLIHDGVRPFMEAKNISSLIKEAKRYGAAILGVPVKATIKRVKVKGLRVKGRFIVEKTLDRNNLWEVQTPQVFKKELILKAYKKFGNTLVTDDASLVEKLGVKVRIVMGTYSNIKITTAEDLIIAKAICHTELV